MKFKLVICEAEEEQVVATVHKPSALTQKIEQLVLQYAGNDKLAVSNEDELLMLTPVCVKPEFQRQHISRDMIEFGFARAREMGFKACIVEGNPANYRNRGFVTAAEHGILPGKTVHLPRIECLMATELIPGAFETIQGEVEYDFYECLNEE